MHPAHFTPTPLRKSGSIIRRSVRASSAKLAALDWEAENRAAAWYDVYTAMTIPYCYEGGNAHQGGLLQ